MNLAQAIFEGSIASAVCMPAAAAADIPKPVIRVHYQPEVYYEVEPEKPARELNARNGSNHRLGEGHGRAKLTDEQVRRMRRMYNPGVVGYEALADEFHCGASTVRDIVNGRTRVSA